MSNLNTIFALGPQRTGTTWLYWMLREHSQILVPATKETHYFCYHDSDFKDGKYFTHGIDHYKSYVQYPDKLKEILGDQKTYFLESTACNARLKENLISVIHANMPDAKLIMFIRDPAERAWSHYKLKNFSFHTKIDQKLILIDEMIEFIEQKHMKQCDDFVGNIERWSKYFGEESMYIDWFENISKEPEELLKRILKFLDLPIELNVMRRAHEKICWTEPINKSDEIREKLDELRKVEREQLVKVYGRYK